MHTVTTLPNVLKLATLFGDVLRPATRHASAATSLKGVAQGLPATSGKPALLRVRSWDERQQDLLHAGRSSTGAARAGDSAPRFPTGIVKERRAFFQQKIEKEDKAVVRHTTRALCGLKDELLSTAQLFAGSRRGVAALNLDAEVAKIHAQEGSEAALKVAAAHIGSVRNASPRLLTIEFDDGFVFQTPPSSVALAERTAPANPEVPGLHIDDETYGALQARLGKAIDAVRGQPRSPEVDDLLASANAHLKNGNVPSSYMDCGAALEILEGLARQSSASSSLNASPEISGDEEVDSASSDSGLGIPSSTSGSEDEIQPGNHAAPQRSTEVAKVPAKDRKVRAPTDAQCTRKLRVMLSKLADITLKHPHTERGQVAKSLRAETFALFEGESSRAAYDFCKPRMDTLATLSKRHSGPQQRQVSLTQYYTDLVAPTRPTPVNPVTTHKASSHLSAIGRIEAQEADMSKMLALLDQMEEQVRRSPGTQKAEAIKALMNRVDRLIEKEHISLAAAIADDEMRRISAMPVRIEY